MFYNGVDLSSNNGVVNITNLKDCDFVIVKATQGVSYVNPLFASHVEEALARGLMVGAYHYFSGGDAVAEARHFLNIVRPYLGRVTLWLDWESNQNAKFGAPLVAVQWLEYVLTATGVTPGVYMSKGEVRKFSGYNVTKFPLWVAQYANMRPTSWQSAPWCDGKPFTPWVAPFIHQYSSRGQVWPHKGWLDLNRGNFTREQWDALLVPPTVAPDSPAVPVSRPLALAEAVCGVLRGDYGTGSERVRKLRAAGLDAEDVQKVVNLCINLTRG